MKKIMMLGVYVSFIFPLTSFASTNTTTSYNSIDSIITGIEQFFTNAGFINIKPLTASVYTSQSSTNAGMTATTPSVAHANGDAIIYNAQKNLALYTSDYLAGAISAIVWNGTQYIMDVGHGSSLQYAFSVDGLGELYNPTEAGARKDDYHLRVISDADGHTASMNDLNLHNDFMIAPSWATTSQQQLTSSILTSFNASANSFNSTVQPAFWLTPDGPRETWSVINANGKTISGVYPAPANTATLSNYVLSKSVEVGAENISNVIKLDASLNIPAIDKDLSSALNNPKVYSSVSKKNRTNPTENLAWPTGYLLKTFNLYYEISNPGSNPSLINISQSHGIKGVDSPYETNNMIILSTSDSNNAMGVYSVPEGNSSYVPTYSTYVNSSAFSPGAKWDVDYDVSIGPAPTVFRARTYLAFGSVKNVENTLVCLYKKYHDNNSGLDCSTVNNPPPPSTPTTNPSNNTTSHIPSTLPAASLTVDCFPNLSLASINKPVIWTISATGGKAPYSYYWSDATTNIDPIHTVSLSRSYPTIGKKYMGIAVIDAAGTNSGWKFCSKIVSVQ
jgi:hypothetical protein